MKQPVYLIHSDEYKNWIFDSSHPTQGRRFDNARNLFMKLANQYGIAVIEISPNVVYKGELLRVHTAEYIEEVLEQHRSSEWVGEREDLAILASRFVQGTLNALDNLMVGNTQLAIHFPGAKHHAQADHSSGFCVFADFAIAADIATEYGKKVAILDIDGHHGDGTENLTKDNLNVLTFSIHEYGIFPGTGYVSYPEKHVYNYPLGSTEPGHNPNKDDQALLDGVTVFCELAKQFNPDLLFIACGADGHIEDPLTSLEYSVDGYIAVAKRLKERFPDLPILLGGAGGYLPDTRTPEVWVGVMMAISTSNSKIR
jgi:acetoin utilization protein AcuC